MVSKYMLKMLHTGELLPLVSTAWETRQAAADAQASRNRDVDQPAEDRLATLLSSSELTTCLENYSITKRNMLELIRCFLRNDRDNCSGFQAQQYV